MKWIGLTGGLATGKSTVANLLRENGYFVIDADALVHSLTNGPSPVLTDLRRVFSDAILTSSGQLDRKKLAQIVFNDPEALKKLEDVLHPKVRQAMLLEKKRLQEAGCEMAFYDVPLLFEKNLEDEFDAIVVVTSTETLQIQRMQVRNGWTQEEIKLRMKSQLPLDFKRDRAHYVIENSSSLDDLKKQVETVISQLNLLNS